jgi:hypothetical protein
MIGMISDDSGGVIVGWIELDNSPYRFRKFVQRMDRYGRLFWGPDGIEIAPNDSLGLFSMCSDGVGGVVVTWRRKNQLLADRISGNGKSTWSARGVPVFEHPASEAFPDGRGGVIVAWGPKAQRLDGRGQRLWGADGVSISTCVDDPITTGGQDPVRFSAPDGEGGCFLVWRGCPDLSVSRGIYAQHIDASGRELWASGGIPVGGPIGNRSIADCLADGGGGVALLLVEDYSILLAQHVSADGQLRSGPTGVKIAEASYRPTADGLALDPGHLLVSWSKSDYRSPTTSGLFATEVALDSETLDAPRQEFQVRPELGKSRTLELALEGFRSNPAHGAIQIAFTLSGTSPARLELYSASGKRVFTQEVSSLGAGSHVISLGRPGFSAGVYWLRVSQAGQSITKQSVILE